MRIHFVAPVLASVVLGILVACSGGTGTVPSDSHSTPVKEGEVSAPSGLKVEATISAATLGDDCGGGGSGFAPPQGDCAPAADGGGCGGGFACRQSNVQLAFKAGAGTASAKIEIVSVTFHDATDGKELDQLEASNPQSWNGTGYATWDQTIAPNAEVKASYSLSAPEWSKIESSAKGTSQYSKEYRLRVTLRIGGGSPITLESEPLTREPAVVT